MTNEVFSKKEKFFDRWASSYDCLFTTVFYQAIHKRMLEFVELKDDANVLDLGCGTGKLLNRLAKKFPSLRGTGLDLSEEMLHQAKQKNQYGDRLTYRLGNVESLPFADAEFDAVFNTISFLHYPNPQQVFIEVSRVLQSQGCFYLADYTVRDENNPGYFPFSPGGLKFYSPKKRQEFAINSGLECVGHYYLLGPVLLSIFRKN
jgi:ubiquinone/menaquinone biosynthesis C-methylase UbiE